ncbi:MAG: hypothetical protein JO250_08575 [Armatimonadetes bacterium]|nr:hypothetical protein [Armatimonadota bacterium]
MTTLTVNIQFAQKEGQTPMLWSPVDTSCLALRIELNGYQQVSHCDDRTRPIVSPPPRLFAPPGE